MKQCLAIAGLIFCLAFAAPDVYAKSQCSGLSSSACAGNNTCTWRKSSVDKNGKKTKAHCRALPGKAKVTKTKASNTKAAKKVTSAKDAKVKSKNKAKSKVKSKKAAAKNSKPKKNSKQKKPK